MRCGSTKVGAKFRFGIGPLETVTASVRGTRPCKNRRSGAPIFYTLCQRLKSRATRPGSAGAGGGRLAFSFWLSGMGRRAGDPFYLHDEAVAEIKTRSRRLHRLPTLAQNARMGHPPPS